MKFKIELEEQELNLIASALYKLPYETVAALITSIGNQINAQQKSEKETKK